MKQTKPSLVRLYDSFQEMERGLFLQSWSSRRSFHHQYQCSRVTREDLPLKSLMNVNWDTTRRSLTQKGHLWRLVKHSPNKECSSYVHIYIFTALSLQAVLQNDQVVLKRHIVFSIKKWVFCAPTGFGLQYLHAKTCLSHCDSLIHQCTCTTNWFRNANPCDVWDSV